MFNSTKIDNGLTVITYNMPHVESISINLIVCVGSRFETKEEEGISHFLEHMAFKGTYLRSAKMIAEEFDVIGGQFNAYTSRERTVYYAKVLKDNFTSSLEIIADIIQNSIFNEDDITKEYEVILQEIAEGEDDPEEIGYEKFYNLAYPNQPMGKSILGTKKSLKNFDKTSFSNYLAKNYLANNIYLSIAGNIEHDYAVKVAQKLFSSLQKRQAPNFTPAKYQGGYAAITKKLEQTTFILGFESTHYLEMNQFYHNQILSLILGGGISSRLFQQIRENLGLVYGIGSYNSGYLDSGLFSIYASTTPEKLSILTDNIINEIKKIGQDINQIELARAKMQIRSNIYMAEEQSNYKSENIGKNYAIFGKYFSPEDLMNIIEQTTINDIKHAAEKIFTTNPTLIIVGPGKDNVDYEKLCNTLKQ